MTTVVLWLFPFIEGRIDQSREEHVYEVTFPVNLTKVEALEARMRALGLRLRSCQHIKLGADMKCSWVVTGRPRDHESCVHKILSDSEV